MIIKVSRIGMPGSSGMSKMTKRPPPKSAKMRHATNVTLKAKLSRIGLDTPRNAHDNTSLL